MDLVSDVSDDKLATFGRRFLRRYADHGFQSMQKRDVELLLFYELELCGVIDPGSDNHSIAKTLRVTPARVKALRRDAWARWAEANEVRDHLRQTLAKLFCDDALATLLTENEKVCREDRLLPVLLEHPSDRAEVEQALKRRHSVPRYARNREVLLVPHQQLIALADELVPGGVDKKHLATIRAAFLKDATLKSLLTKDLSKLSWAEARTVLNTMIGEVLQKASVDVTAKALSGALGALFR